MKDYNIKEIRKKLEKELEEKRFNHTLGVADAAFCLALRYGEDPAKAYLAGLLHDCAKCYDTDHSIKLCEKYHLELSESEMQNPSLIHAPLGAMVAKDKYEVEEKDILDAIKYHTVGRPDMTLLEKIIFSADYIEPGRNKILGLDEIRRVIFEDLDKAVYLIYVNTLEHLRHKELPYDNHILEAMEFYR